jgi:outer membrane lipopolysaccharide assembly protein LptE/RlpB
MMRATLKMALVLAVAGLAACGEKPQTLGAGKTDVSPYQGAENAFAASGWKAGDKTSWEQALKARALNTQNEYSKTK